MPDVIVFKDETGRLDGLGEKHRRAFMKFHRTVGEMEPGETMRFSYRLPRSPVHHRYFFWRLQALFDRQEQFGEVEHLLAWLKVGSGHVVLVPGNDGAPVALPKTINWDSLDETGFTEVHRAIRDFLWTPHAQAFLWPHLNPEQRYVMVDVWSREGEKHRHPPNVKTITTATKPQGATS